MKLLNEILMWAEVWALLFPIVALLRYKIQPDLFKPVIVYIWIALVLNTVATVIAMFSEKYGFPDWLTTNNYLYNMHSIARFACFLLFFKKLKLPFGNFTLKWLPLLATVFLIINFLFFENFFHFTYFSSRLLTIESS